MSRRTETLSRAEPTSRAAPSEDTAPSDNAVGTEDAMGAEDPGDTEDARTTTTLAYLHRARGDARGRRRGGAVLLAYGVALLGGMWGVPALVTAARAEPAWARDRTVSGALEAGFPAAAVCLLALTLLLMVRGALWRGPVLLDPPTVTWLTPTPLRRARLLLPRLWSSSLLAAATGLTAGAAAGLLLHGLDFGPWPALTAAGAWAGAVTALTGTALGGLVERFPRWTARHAARLFLAGWSAVLLGGAVAVLSAVAGTSGLATRVSLWSGPWGWAAQPLVAAGGAGAPWWGAAVPLALGTVSALGVLCVRQVPSIPQAALRFRATVSARVGDALGMLDLRRARAGVPALRERGARPALRLPPPRRRWLLPLWRDLTCLLRSPGRLGWAAVWTLAAVALTVLAAGLGADARRLAAVAALVAEYLAAAQLTEPARVESDDIRRSAALPHPARRLAAWHAVVHGALLLGWLGLGAVVCAAGGWAGSAGAGLVSLVAAAPAFVMAALVSSYRGVMPVHVVVGLSTPMGDTGPAQMAVWYLRGPLAAVALTAPAQLSVVGGGGYGVPQLTWHALLAAAGLWWARRTAHSLRER